MPSAARCRRGRAAPRGSTLRAACLLACVLAVPSGVARADLWGYLDADGVAHFATEKLDERYQLFYKGETNVDAAARARAAAPAEAISRVRASFNMSRGIPTPPNSPR